MTNSPSREEWVMNDRDITSNIDDLAHNHEYCGLVGCALCYHKLNQEINAKLQELRSKNKNS